MLGIAMYTDIQIIEHACFDAIYSYRFVPYGRYTSLKGHLFTLERSVEYKLTVSGMLCLTRKWAG